MAVPSYGLNDQGEARIQAGDCQSVIRLTGARAVEAQWFNAEGKALKAAPAEVKKAYPQGLKDWQKQAAEITDALIGQASRLEASYLSGRQWRYADWRERFLLHPLLGWLGRRLIWVFEQADQTRHGLSLDGRLIIISGGENISSIEIEDVLYRHPAVMAAAEIIEHCRKHLAGFKLSRAVVFEELPKTSTGKIQKFELRKKAGSAQAIDV